MTILRRLRKPFDESILARALGSNVLLLVVTVALLMATVLLIQRSALRSQFDLRGRMLAEFVGIECELPMLVGNRPELERIARRALSLEDVLFVSLQDAAGEIRIEISRSDRKHHGFLEVVAPVLEPAESGIVEWESRTAQRRRQGSVRLQISVDRESGLFWQTVMWMLAVAAAVGILTLAADYYHLKHEMKPLQRLVGFAQQVGRGNLSCSAEVVRPDEVGRLTMAFNHMVETLSRTTVSRNYMDDVIRSMNESLLVLDSERRIRTVNRATIEMLGCPEDDLLGQPVSGILHEPEPASGESAYRRKDGSLVPVVISRAFLQSAAGVPNGEVWVAQDVTERIRTENELRRAKKEAEDASRAKSDFLSRTSHELRTPLNAILGFGQLLASGNLDEADRESADQILKGGHHLLGLINEVLDIAGIESGRRTLSIEPVDAGAVAEEAVAFVQPTADQRRIRIGNRIPSGQLAYVMADHQRLKQVFLNLLSNAVKYNHEAGTVELSCLPLPGERLRILVRDDGPGVPLEKRDRLFMPFERLGAEQSGIEGSGLGLAVTKTMVEAMGGVIRCESAPGQGSTFWFELDAAQLPSPSGGDLAGCAETALSRKAGDVNCTVLYIEDTVSNVRLLERIVELRPGVRLVTATRGLDGLRAARAESPDLILLDLHLPDMNGGDVIRTLKWDPVCRSIPVIVLSADATPSQIDRLMGEGAVAYLTKPLNIERLLVYLDDSIKKKVTTDV